MEQEDSHIIGDYPLQFKDELDKWLFDEFGIMAGCCSSIKSMEYHVAREVAEKAIEVTRQETKKQTIEKAVEWMKENLTFMHPRKERMECLVNIGVFKDAMNEED